MKKLSSFLIILTLLASCKKEDKTVDILYKIVRNSATAPGYIVRYTRPDGATDSKGPINDATWTSGNLGKFKKGTALYFAQESYGGDFTMYIYENGNLHSTRASGGGSTTAALTYTAGN